LHFNITSSSAEICTPLLCTVSFDIEHPKEVTNEYRGPRLDFNRNLLRISRPLVVNVSFDVGVQAKIKICYEG
jgi:hypothetical protein